MFLFSGKCNYSVDSIVGVLPLQRCGEPGCSCTTQECQPLWHF